MTSILVVDDDGAVRSATQILLEANGFDVITVPDGMSAVNAVQAGQIDLAIVDLFMTGMDGLETAKALRKQCPRMPIITASGFMFGGSGTRLEMPDFEAMALEAGATATVYKPFRPKELLQIIQEVLKSVA